MADDDLVHVDDLAPQCDRASAAMEQYTQDI